MAIRFRAFAISDFEEAGWAEMALDKPKKS